METFGRASAGTKSRAEHGAVFKTAAFADSAIAPVRRILPKFTVQRNIQLSGSVNSKRTFVIIAYSDN